MSLKIRISSIVTLFMSCQFGFCQIQEFKYTRELNGVTEQWHRIVLPDELFSRASQGLNDLRIFGITEDQDTIEAPYFLRLTTEKISNKTVAFNQLNESHNDEGYYYTFEIPTTEAINQIELDFNKKNFDWKVNLEGSQDQNNWFTVLENYRILSIKNSLTDYQFTRLSFSDSKYRFFRLLVKSKKNPDLQNASISQYESSKGQFRNYDTDIKHNEENKNSNQTIMSVSLAAPARISSLSIKVGNTYDYYRPVTIQQLVDSIETEQGWRYQYSTLTSGTISSLEPNYFRFPSTTLQQLKIIISNQDNEPLTIDSIQAHGYIHELVARFTSPAKYYLVYGDPLSDNPQYDIDRFKSNIPKELVVLEPGPEQVVITSQEEEINPLFVNKNWLWGVMIAIIFLLGWFSLRMMRKG